MTWQTVKLINHVGALIAPEIPIAVSSEQLMSSGISAEAPGGIYTSDGFTLARNIGAGVGDIRPIKWPAGVTVRVGGCCKCTTACAVHVRISRFLTYGRRYRIGACCGAFGSAGFMYMVGHARFGPCAR